MNTLYRKVKDIFKLLLILLRIANVFISTFQHKLAGKGSTSPKKLGNFLVILGNGPNQNKFFEKKDLFLKYDIMCVNFFPLKCKSEFFELKPKFFCIADPVFKINSEREDVRQLFQILETVDWKFYIVKPYNMDIGFRNTNIRMISINGNEYCEDLCRNTLYRKNMAIPCVNNVVNMAIYFAITFHFSQIALFGVESNLFTQYVIDINNTVLAEETHVYGKNITNITNLHNWNKGDFHKILYSWYRTFFSYSLLRSYADKEKCSIINYCPDSYIDVFPKKEL